MPNEIVIRVLLFLSGSMFLAIVPRVSLTGWRAHGFYGLLAPQPTPAPMLLMFVPFVL